MGRWLFHIGDRVFYPGGAAAVRIAFKLQADSRVMTVSDADFVLTAPRREG
jgi:hypothetical protein